MSNYQQTRIAADGLHYKSKEGGSLFMDSSNDYQLLQMRAAQAQDNGHVSHADQSTHVHVRRLHARKDCVRPCPADACALAGKL